MNTYVLICAALLPAIVLCIYIFKKDQTEKEPISLLLWLLFLGACTCYPAAITEGVLLDIINGIFSPFMEAENGARSLSGITYHLYIMAENFIGVALVEEGFKFIALYFATRKSKHFNSLFDGVIYAVFVSLGFAALENILYVLSNGFVNAVMRAITAVPGHMFFGVLMGYYYSMAHMYDKAGIHEETLIQNGYISGPATLGQNSKKYRIYGIVMAILAHGFYDYCCSVQLSYSTLLFIGFLIFLYIYCFGKIKKTSKGDISDMHYAMRIVLKKYPKVFSAIKNDEPAQKF